MPSAANVMKDGIVVSGSDLVGQPLDRVDGPGKVMGQVKYAAEFVLPRMAHAHAFTSTIACGHVLRIETGDAEEMPGVIAVISRANAPRLNNLTRDNKRLVGQPGQTIALLQDDAVHYAGQYLGLVVAETWEQAREAASRVKITYEARPATIDMNHPIGEVVVPKKMGRGDKPDTSRGDADAAFATAAIKVQQTYCTPVESHNPMEMHATLAQWEGQKLTLYDATQHVEGVKSVAAAYLDMPPEDVRVISPYVGGGFGCKGSVWPHVYLAAIAARHVGRPVRLVVTRRQMFAQTGYRPPTLQRIGLGAGTDGKLVAITHDTINQTSDFDEWVEPAGKPTTVLYSCPNVRTTHRLARVNMNTPCQMRTPGEASGTAALEIAMDELAYAARLDPLELRCATMPRVTSRRKSHSPARRFANVTEWAPAILVGRTGRCRPGACTMEKR